VQETGTSGGPGWYGRALDAATPIEDGGARPQGVAMPIRVDAYIAGGLASGVLARAGHLRDILEGAPSLDLERASWWALGETTGRPAGDISIPVDDLLIAAADDDPVVPVHASWHPVQLEVGPYRVDGELPTLPGYDPGRSLTRPTGEFVMLRDVRLAMLSDPGPGAPIGHHALVNRYGVERVTADLMLGFFFPGASMDGQDAEDAATAAPT